tara:strand:- start:6825 stop:7217 length:393 start_codon:yes stop_codon:yes gene_type:complete
MSDTKKDIDNLLGHLEPKAVEEINKALGSVKVEEGWQKTMMGVLIETVDNYGVEGLSKARELVWSAIEGKEFDEESFNALSLRKQSDLLAYKQNIEADKKSAAKDFFTIVGDTLGGVLLAVAKGMVARSL